VAKTTVGLEEAVRAVSEEGRGAAMAEAAGERVVTVAVAVAGAVTPCLVGANA